MGTTAQVAKRLERLRREKQFYEAAIEREYQGAPQMRKVGRTTYLYIAKKIGTAPLFHYIGRLRDTHARKVVGSIKRRRRYEKLLRKVQGNLKRLGKGKKGKRNVTESSIAGGAR
jgi:hypothetical protein